MSAEPTTTIPEAGTGPEQGTTDSTIPEAGTEPIPEVGTIDNSVPEAGTPTPVESVPEVGTLDPTQTTVETVEVGAPPVPQAATELPATGDATGVLVVVAVALVAAGHLLRRAVS